MILLSLELLFVDGSQVDWAAGGQRDGRGRDQVPWAADCCAHPFQGGLCQGGGRGQGAWAEGEGESQGEGCVPPEDSAGQHQAGGEEEETNSKEFRGNFYTPL